MAISVPPRRRFNWTSRWFVALVAVVAVVSLTIGIALGIGAFRHGSPSGGPIAFSPSPTSSTSPTPASAIPATPSESPSPPASPSASPSPTDSPTRMPASPVGLAQLLGWDGVDHQIVMADVQSGGMNWSLDRSTMVFVDDRWFFAPAAKTLPGHVSGLVVYDSGRNRELFIATGLSMKPEPADVWEWDGAAWTKITTSVPTWEATDGSSAAYSPVLHATVLFDSWSARSKTTPTRIWDGSSWRSVVTQHRPAVASGDQLGEVQLAYDPSRKSIIGLSLVDFTTWIFDGSDWTQLPLSGGTPKARTNPGVAFDSHAGRWVLFGGAFFSPMYQDLGDTWTGDGTSWTQLAPALSPSPRETRMVFDPDRQRIVLFAGRQGLEEPADTWAWDGGNWRQLAG